MKRKISFEELFQNKPAWLFGVALGGSYDRVQRRGFARLSLRFGYHLTNWFVIGGQSDVRLDRLSYWHIGVRWGFLYRRAKFSISFIPAMIGLLWSPKTNELGPVFSPILELNYQLSHNYSLFISLQADILFNKLGFDSDRQYLSGTLGWRIFF